MLPENTQGTFEVLSNTLGSLSTLICELPYPIVGDPNYICTIDGEWRGTGRCSKLIFNV